MFSIAPIRRMFVFCAITAARDATSFAAGCGVVTTTTSARGSSWPSEIETSPVPGGMSTTSRSSSPQCTSVRNCSSARCSIGPRHITGALSSRKKPIDINFRSCATGGTIIRSTSTGFCVDPEHVRNRVPVDVRVENADLPAELRERRGEVDRQRRLADAALAARDREHARAAVERQALRASGHAAAEPLGQRCALVRRHHVELERDAFHACDGRERFGDLLLEAVAKRATGDGERDHDDDVAAVDLDVAHHLQLGDGTPQLGVDHLLERGEDRFA